MLTASDVAEVAKTKKELPDDKVTYEGFRGSGSALPVAAINELTMIKGNVPAGSLVGPFVVLFWAKFAKGDYRTMVHFSYLMRALPGLRVLGVSCDPDLDDAKAIMKKAGTPMPTQSIPELCFDMPLAFDADKKVLKIMHAEPSPSLSPTSALALALASPSPSPSRSPHS